jgi:hypothetical protein
MGVLHLLERKNMNVVKNIVHLTISLNLFADVFRVAVYYASHVLHPLVLL